MGIYEYNVLDNDMRNVWRTVSYSMAVSSVKESERIWKRSRLNLKMLLM